jgi:hypothetical protein
MTHSLIDSHVSGNSNYLPRKQKSFLDMRKEKIMLEIFLMLSFFVHYEFTPEGLTINKEMYVETLRRLRLQ